MLGFLHYSNLILFGDNHSHVKFSHPTSLPYVTKLLNFFLQLKRFFPIYIYFFLKKDFPPLIPVSPLVYVEYHENAKITYAEWVFGWFLGPENCAVVLFKCGSFEYPHHVIPRNLNLHFCWYFLNFQMAKHPAKNLKF